MEQSVSISLANENLDEKKEESSQNNEKDIEIDKEKTYKAARPPPLNQAYALANNSEVIDVRNK